MLVYRSTYNALLQEAEGLKQRIRFLEALCNQAGLPVVPSKGEPMVKFEEHGWVFLDDTIGRACMVMNYREAQVLSHIGGARGYTIKPKSRSGDWLLIEGSSYPVHHENLIFVRFMDKKE